MTAQAVMWATNIHFGLQTGLAFLMNHTNKSRPLGARILRLLVLNILVALAVALICYWAKGKSDYSHLSSLITSSIIHSIFYGLMFGLLMPYIAERLTQIKRP